MRRGVNARYGVFYAPDAVPPSLREAAALLTRGLRFGMPDMPGTLPFRDVVIAAGVIGHGAMMIAVCGAVGAGEISHRIGEIGVGIAQPFRRSGVAKAAGSGELDLHQADRAAAPDEVGLITALAQDHPMHQ